MVVLKTPGEVDLMDDANCIVHRVLDEVAEMLVPGMTTAELDRHAESTIRKAGAVPAFLNYKAPRPFLDGCSMIAPHAISSAIFGAIAEAIVAAKALFFSA